MLTVVLTWLVGVLNKFSPPRVIDGSTGTKVMIIFWTAIKINKVPIIGTKLYAIFLLPVICSMKLRMDVIINSPNA
jgi:hypothetical protein